MKEVTLPSGRKIEITPAPFNDSKKLYQAFGGELLRVEIDGGKELSNLIKNILCLGISSAAVEAALAPCLKRCTYNGVKILLPDTFEPVEAREDYLDICVEVAKENVSPFTKSLFAQFKGLMVGVASLLPSPSSTTQMGSSPISESATQDTAP